MDKVMDYLKNTKILGIIANVILLIAVALPIGKVTVSLFGFSQSDILKFIPGYGVYVLILALVNLVIIFADKLTNIIPLLAKVSNQKYTLIPTAIIAVILLIFTFSAPITVKAEYTALATLNFAIGFYLLWLGTIASAVYPFLYKENSTINNVTTNNTPTNSAFTNNVPTNNVPTDNAFTNNVATDNVPTNNASTDNVATDNIPTDNNANSNN